MKGTWTGRKNEATYFGKHFHLSCEEMNMLFAFAGKDRRSMKLHTFALRLFIKSLTVLRLLEKKLLMLVFINL